MILKYILATFCKKVFYIHAIKSLHLMGILRNTDTDVALWVFLLSICHQKWIDTKRPVQRTVKYSDVSNNTEVDLGLQLTVNLYLALAKRLIKSQALGEKKAVVGALISADLLNVIYIWIKERHIILCI